MVQKNKKNYVSVANVGDLTRKEWLHLRKNYIGGSDAGAVCGLNPWRSPLSVYLDKTSEEIDDKDNFSMKLGRYLEDTVVKLFEEETIKMLIEYEKEFWKNLKEGVAPDPDGSNDYAEILKKKYKGDIEDEIDLSEKEINEVVNSDFLGDEFKPVENIE